MSHAPMHSRQFSLQRANKCKTPASLHTRICSKQLGRTTLGSLPSRCFYRHPNSLFGPLASKLRIAVDVDEVLGRFVYTLNRFCKEEYQMDFEVQDYDEYNFAKVWACSKERSHHIVHEFFKSAHFQNGIPAIPGALNALQRLALCADLVVVTSRQHVIQEPTLTWLDTHYPGVFQEVYFGNHFALEGSSVKKSDICRSIGADILIDDNPVYALECAGAGIHVLLYDWNHSYPWSKLPNGMRHPLITVVKDWDDVEMELANLSTKLMMSSELTSSLRGPSSACGFAVPTH